MGIVTGSVILIGTGIAVALGVIETRRMNKKAEKDQAELNKAIAQASQELQKTKAMLQEQHEREQQIIKESKDLEKRLMDTINEKTKVLALK